MYRALQAPPRIGCHACEVWAEQGWCQHVGIQYAMKQLVEAMRAFGKLSRSNRAQGAAP